MKSVKLFFIVSLISISTAFMSNAQNNPAKGLRHQIWKEVNDITNLNGENAEGLVWVLFVVDQSNQIQVIKTKSTDANLANKVKQELNGKTIQVNQDEVGVAFSMDIIFQTK